jgi:hypothetical protein
VHRHRRKVDIEGYERKEETQRCEDHDASTVSVEERVKQGASLTYSLTLKIEATCCSETSLSFQRNI